jgi:uncharacterized protein (DUF952 family)
MICHLVDAGLWAEAVAAGEYRPPSLAAEGFIHFSTPAQLVATANAFYAGVRGLVVLEVDDATLSPEDLRWEPAPDRDERFPHLYRPLRPSEVVAVRSFEPGPDGSFA